MSAATLDELEARIAALEAQRNPDTLQSNVITVDNGVIGADFTGDIRARSLVDTATDGKVFDLTSTGALSLKGTINAQGLTLPSAVTGAQLAAINQIEWIPAAGGALVAAIGAYNDNSGTDGILNLSANAPAFQPGYNTSVSYAQLVGNDQNGNPYATLQSQVGVVQGQNTLGELYAIAKQNANAPKQKMILDGAGNSDFIQGAGSNQQARFQVGVTGFGCNADTWTGAPINFPNPYSAGAWVVYSLYVASGQINLELFSELVTVTPSMFQVNFYYQAAATIYVYWMAMGT